MSASKIYREGGCPTRPKTVWEKCLFTGDTVSTSPVDFYQNNTHLFANEKWPAGRYYLNILKYP